MPKLKKRIRDTELRDFKLLRKEQVLLSPGTYQMLIALAREKVETMDLTPLNQVFSPKKVSELAANWVKSGAVPPRMVEKFHEIALIRPPNIVREACVKAFLEAHPNVKMAENKPGRPAGNLTSEAKMRVAMGLVITDLINSSPSLPSRKALKVA